MDVKEKYDLWQNTVVADYKKNTKLVMNSISRRLMIQKNVSKEGLAIYKKLVMRKHPNLVKIYDISENGSGGIILEQLIDGVTLEYYLQHVNSTPVEKESIILQICDGLLALHEMNIVHRDLTPSNIMLTDDGEVKIIDFDIARTPKRGAKRDTVLMGTEGFAAPEQFGFYQSDFRTDIYTLGIIINYVYTGDLPAFKPYKDNYQMVEIIRKCTEIDPDKRFNDVNEVKEAILKATGRENEKNVQKAEDFAGILDMMLTDLPGFRPHSKIPKFIAVLLYLFSIWFIAAAFVTYCKTPYQLLLCTGVTIFGFVIPFFCFSDYLSFQSKVFRRLRPVSRRRLFVIAGWMSILSALLMIGAIPRA